MLVLSGRIGERFIIGGPGRDLVVVVKEVRGNKIRLGFEGEADVDREAVWESKYGQEATAEFARQVVNVLGNPPYSAQEQTDGTEAA